MANGSRYVTPYAYAYKSTGVPIPGALLNFYVTESATRSDTFKTNDLAGPVNTNPVVADDKGTFPSIFLDPAVVYKVVHTHPDVPGVGAAPIWTADPVYVQVDNGVDTGGGGGGGGGGGSGVLPAGAIMIFGQNVAPIGWLSCNGAAVARTLYPDLFAAIGATYGAGDGVNTFNVPELRGEFPRGWDNGRGVDAGRALGSMQAADFLAHTHTAEVTTDGDHTHDILVHLNDGTGPFFADSDGGGVPHTLPTSSAGAHTHTVTNADAGGTETRPRNVALHYCIKATNA